MNRLSSPITASKKSDWYFLTPLFVLYAIAVVLLAYTHEPWRDEVRAWSITLQIDSLSDLLRVSRSEGHPPLWYLILCVAQVFTQNPVALKAISVFVALLAGFLIIRSPYFYKSEKTLWLFGVLPLYEYAAQCRNYGIGMLALFACCTVYPQRRQSPFLYLFLLLLLSTTSALAFLVAISLFLSLIAEYVFDNKQKCHRREVAGSILLTCGFLLVIMLMWPEKQSIVTESHSLSPFKALAGISWALLSQASFATDALSLRLTFFPIFVLLPLYYLLRRSPYVLIYSAAAVWSLTTFHVLVYNCSALRHQGFLVLILFSTLWMYRAGLATRVTYTPLISISRLSILFLLILQIDNAYVRALPDLHKPMSSAKQLAAFIQSEPMLQDAILIAEPDYYVETVPYYLPNIRIYLPREKQFSQTVSFTTKNAQTLRLGDLVRTAKRLSKKYDVPILLLYGHRYSSPGEYSFSYNKIFSFSEKERAHFRGSFTSLKNFTDAVTDENYRLYRFNQTRQN